jgi:integral membrane protein (TIGR01906 family)
MDSMFQLNADPNITGVDVQEYPNLAEKITSYLLGKADTFQTTLQVHGQMREAFSEKELLHMQDVRNLFSLCRSLLLFCALIVIVGLAMSLFRFRPMLAVLARGYVRVSLFVAVLGVILAIWSAIDFLSLFRLFHKLFFTNDLWLLNPKQDLLVQLMPTSFFVGYAAQIGMFWLLGAAVFFAAAILYLKRRKKQA